MMKKLLTISLFLMMTTPLYAGSGHDHGHSHGHNHDHSHDHHKAAKLDDTGVINAASQAVSKLVQQKQLIEGSPLDKKWSAVLPENKYIFQKGKGYYIVKFTVADKSLYILLRDNGDIYDANFSGQFVGLR